MVNQLLQRQCSCDEALSFFLNFNELETNLYFILVQKGQQTVSEMCDIVDRNQSTVYTAIEKLVSHGIVIKNKRGKEKRGYEYVYVAIDPPQVKSLLLEKLEKLYSNMKNCIQEFDVDALNCDINY